MLKLKVLVIGIVLFGSMLFGAKPANAAYVDGCTRGVCIGVWTGGKNHSNRTQWVDEIYVMPNTHSYKVEAWADGYYGAAYNTGSRTFVIRRWVRNGTYVCGAATFYNGGPRYVACIAIRV